MKHCLISYVEVLRDLSDADRSVLSARFLPRTVAEGEALFAGGKTCDVLFFICKGVLKIHSVNEKGMEITHFFYKENQFCTILDSFQAGVYTEVSIAAACSAEVLQISKTNLIALYDQLPFMKGIVDQAIQQGLMEKVRLRNSYLGLAADHQYRLFLAQQPEIALRVAVKDMASFLGITPQSLSRIRKQTK
jgi:CRP-like cAMP-binding protein